MGLKNKIEGLCAMAMILCAEWGIKEKHGGRIGMSLL